MKAILFCSFFILVCAGCSITPMPVTDIKWDKSPKSDQLARTYGYMEDDEVYDQGQAPPRSKPH